MMISELTLAGEIVEKLTAAGLEQVEQLKVLQLKISCS